MAAIATKKPFGDLGLSLTFPANFAKAFNAGISYYPSDNGPSIDILVGSDFQSQYHEQKRLESNQSVMNGLQAKRSAELKLMTGLQNYHLPKPVLGQRKYANPSVGAEAYSSTRRDNGLSAPFKTVEVGMMGSGLVGGRLIGGGVKTLEAQTFYKKQLMDRIRQLDRLNAVAQGYTVSMGDKVNTESNETSGSIDKVTFFLYLRTLSDSVTEGDLARFSFENLKELMKMLFNFGPYATQEDFRDILASADETLESLRDSLSLDPSAALPPSYRAYADTLLLFMKAFRSYTTEMFRNMNLSVPDKKSLSASLIKGLGFTSLMKKKDSEGVISEARTKSERLDQAVDDYDNGPDDGEFDQPRTAREDDEQRNAPRAPLAGRNGDPNRNVFGNSNGAVVYGGPTWFGEEMARDGEPQVIAPLSSSGFDPNSQIPPADTDTLKKAVNDAIVYSLQQITNGPIDPENVDQLIESNYPDVNDLVKEIDQRLTEKGFRKAEIARGMELTAKPLFQTYIAENTGDIAPAAAQPAYRASTSLDLPPVMWEDPGDMALGGRPRDEGARQPRPTGSRRSLSELDLPTTREKLREDYNTHAELKSLWNKIPKEWKGESKAPHGNALIKNIQTKIIKLISAQVSSF